MDVTVCVPVYGDDSWITLAEERAVPSVPENVHAVHLTLGDSLADARNKSLASVETEFVCFLDADDELEPGYFEAMERVDGDLRPPMVRYVHPGRMHPPTRMPTVASHHHECTGDCLPFGNWLVIGTVARTDLIREVGGFRDFDVYEDWDLWLRCWQAGATITPARDAVYRAHVRADSRNRGTLSQREKHRVHQDIARANGAPVPA